MKKLSVFCIIMLVILVVGQAFALPGVYNAGSSTMNLFPGACETRTISMDGTGWGTSPLVSGGFLIRQSDDGAAVDITTCQCYDGTLMPAIWDAPVIAVFDPTGFPGGLFVAMANSIEGVIPSSNILLCDVTFCGIKPGETSIRIDTIEWGTWTAQDMSCYDVYIDPAIINASVSINYCEGDFDYDRDVDGTDAAIFKSDFGRSGLTNACPVDGPAAVQKTWQTTSYATGDDGDLQKGIVWPDPRFTDNGNGTVTDNLTGLIWLKNANCFGNATWNNALSACSELAAGDDVCLGGGFSLSDGSQAGDWRLPNYRELFSIIDAENFGEALPDGHPFINVQPSSYWSSTAYAGPTNDAWSISMVYGNVNYNDMGLYYHVWPVRGGH